MSSIPVPMFTEESCVHTTKKACIDAGLPLKAPVVPKSPNKQSLPFSRDCDRAISISFRENSDNNLSTIYDISNDTSYFEQCFYDVEKIGEGSFGVVFRVRFREDNQLYAVKKSKSPFHSNYDKRTKLEEVRKHELIPNHPNCVQLYRSWIEDNFLYLQMELCDTTLETYAAQNHNISEKMLWNILTDMLLAIKNLHDINLIHLDIKLENILMCSDGACKLADFGLVSDVNMIKGDTLEGDQKYLAPELLSGHFTKAADIFSLGIAMLELSCDLMLPTNGILWQQLRKDTFPQMYTKNIPKELFEIIQKMMSSNYLKRPTVDELLKSERIQKLLAKRNKLRRRFFIRNHYLAFIYYLKSIYKLPVWIMEKVVSSLRNSINNSQITVPHARDNDTKDVKDDIKTSPNQYTCPYSSSTPNEKTSESTTQWKMNVEISPINASDVDPVPSHISWDGRWVTKRRPYKEDLAKRSVMNNARANYLPHTPRSAKKKPGMNNNSSPVGRKLFQ